MPEQKSPAILREYRRLAPVYDSKWSFYVKATIRETLLRLSVPPAGQVLDIGCGTGALLQVLSAEYPDARLVGIDAVPEMLAVARKRLPDTVELQEAWAESLPFADDSFDRVVSCNMFHYIREPETALAEMRRVLRPGGELVITDWCDDYWSCRLCNAYLNLFNRAHHRVYRSAECASMIAAAGFSDVLIDRYKINWLWGLMTARAVLK